MALKAISNLYLLKKKKVFIWLLRVLVVTHGIWFPDQDSNLGPLHWEQ